MDNLNNQEQNQNANVSEEQLGRTPPKASDALGVASMILGIVSLVCCCCGAFGAVLGGAAVLLACLSRAKLGRFSGVAVTGLICGIFAALIALVMIVFSGILMNDPEIKDAIESVYAEAGIPLELE